MVHRELNNQNYNVEYYENRDNFYHNVVPMTNERAEIKYGTVKAHEPASILEFDGLTVAKNYYATTNDNVIDVDSYTLADYELVDEVNNYLYTKRQIVKKFGVKQISSFINKHQLDSNNIIYNGFYTSTIVAELDVDKIQEIALDDEVLSVELFHDIN